MKPLPLDQRLEILRTTTHQNAFGELLPTAEVAHRCGCSPAAVKRLIRACLAQAVELLEREGRLHELTRQEGEDDGP